MDAVGNNRQVIGEWVAQAIVEPRNVGAGEGNRAVIRGHA